MDPTPVVVALGQLIVAAWEKWQEKFNHAASAKKEFDDLKDLIEQIGNFLAKAYSKEVIIDKELKRGIKRMQKFLYDSQDAIEDMEQRKSKRKLGSLHSYLRNRYGDRIFTEESSHIKVMLDEYKDNLDKQAHSSSAGVGSSFNAFLEKTDKLEGIKKPVSQLVQWLTENPSKVILVHGAQGVGKTSLVGAVLRDQSVRRCFKYCVWIEDLRSCEFADNRAEALMNAETTMWDLTMEDVNNQQNPAKLGVAFEKMKEKVKSTPRWWKSGKEENFRWALVLDDAGKEDVFKFLQRELIETRPSVIVTTRDKGLISSSMFYLPDAIYSIHDLEHVVLSKDDSCSLFRRNISHHDILPADFNRMVRRCQGLPLTILATCKLLEDSKHTNAAGDSDADRWKKLNDRLEEELLSRGHKVGLNGKMMTLRVDPLLDVRAYLFYLSIFPLDRPIRCSTMMRLWMAERFIKHDQSQENAMTTLQKLLEHYVIWVKKTSYGRVKTCRIHNLQHQLIISNSKNKELAVIVTRPEEGLPEDVRYLSFHIPIREIDKNTSVKQLRSLHFFEEVYPKFLKELLKNVKRLKVLHIQRHLTEEEENRVSLNSFPEKVLQSKNLRYLSLRGTNIRKIPSGIKNLANLETLDLKDTLVHELPNSILKLTKLHHMLVYRSDRSPDAGSNPKLGVKVPSALGLLRSLQKLCMIELNPVTQSKLGRKRRKREQLLEELGTMECLQRLGISKLKSEDVKHLCCSIAKLKNLEALHLIVADGEELDLSEGSKRKEHDRLQRVHLTGALVTLPEWILSPTHLVKLVLKMSQLNEDQFQYLEKLQSLKHLELQKAFNKVSVITFGEGKFEKLRFLGVDIFDNLTSINVQGGALPNLEKLFLGRCKSLTTVPQVITLPPKLTCLEHYDMPKEFVTEVQGNEEVCRRMKVEHKDWKGGVIEDVLKP